jgi:anti-anti-sigma factor
MPGDGAALLSRMLPRGPRFRRGTSLISATQRGEQGRVRVVFEGEIDLTNVAKVIAPVRRAVRAAAPGYLDVDLNRVTFVDCSGIGALMTCHARASAAGCRLTVINAQPMVQRVLGLTNTMETLCGVAPPAA